MPHRYIFMGSVLPQRTCLSLPADSRPIRDASGSVVGTLSIEVYVGQIVATVVREAPLDDVRSFKEGVEGLIRARVDAFGYLRGMGFDVEITTCIPPDGAAEVYGVGIDALGAAEKDRPVTFEALNGLLKSFELRQALADLRCAIRYPFDTSLYCYRAMEAISQAFRSTGTGKESASWDRMRSALRIDRTWLDEDKDEADARRHGRPGVPAMSGPERLAMLERAWKVVDRFCMYLSDPAVLSGQPVLKV